MARGTCTPSMFVDILRRSGHGHLADMLEGKSNGKVARTEGYLDMTMSQLIELESRLDKVYTEEVERHEGNTSLEGLMGCEMDNASFRIHLPPKRVSFCLPFVQLMIHGRRLVSSLLLSYLVAEEEAGRQVGTALAADWVGDKKVTSDFKQMYKLKLNKVRKDDTITDAIFDQLLHDSSYKPSFSKEALWRHMEQTQEKILFVLEGLDRLSPFTSPEIMQLIDKKLLPRASVIVTVAEAKGA
ncbi:Hypp8623 [Branchiostoma lanceolatum]|uniref:Hypp8623 protein n=1 Tax=Branchiostoma lanceolatum TaxID=7740 RepID=A0A8J9Z9G6_BRALA|nr:Hypp8623 [Branchiostoma lanceolatum]